MGSCDRYGCAVQCPIDPVLGHYLAKSIVVWNLKKRSVLSSSRLQLISLISGLKLGRLDIVQRSRNDRMIPQRSPVYSVKNSLISTKRSSKLRYFKLQVSYACTSLCNRARRRAQNFCAFMNLCEFSLYTNALHMTTCLEIHEFKNQGLNSKSE